ncbi:toprim domain-containing protein [Desulfitobacterium metallireducens]|uniref:Small primase-like protein with Toprim domain n=1 Tax=Desulfitobacterium metallireducens DSM 15288 TaxID=871968 RepID=W0E7F5_9FIRM|nr:toprim domain-containing protein [Desulfitobacterium metallireducens]AHF06785.1 small primase-like protein with Toprim domain [Desulfitobacterium metallireducens DSM 15288]
MGKVIIVEGKTDREQLLKVLDEPVEFLCSNGTLSYEKLEEWAEWLESSEIYIFVDADDPGNKLRKRINQELPEVHHLYTHKVYREIATTPIDVLTEILEHAHFDVKVIE